MNQDGKMSYEEVQMLLQMINIDLSEEYAASLFKVSFILQPHLTCFEKNLSSFNNRVKLSVMLKITKIKISTKGETDF